MRVVSDRDLRNVPAKVREALSKGDVVVTSRGKPYAVMMPVPDPERLEETLAVLSRVRAQMALSAVRRRAAETGLDQITDEEIDEEVRQARRERKR